VVATTAAQKTARFSAARWRGSTIRLSGLDYEEFRWRSRRSVARDRRGRP